VLIATADEVIEYPVECLLLASMRPLSARTFRSGQHWSFMTDPAEAAKNTVEISKRYVLDQQLRITRQRELVAKLERDGHPDVVADARRALTEMEQLLIEMEVHYASA
jgi:hypothetical protein